MNVLLISFLINSINIRSLSSYLNANGHLCRCLFCPDPDGNLNTDAIADFIADNEIGMVGVSLVTDDFKAAAQITEAIHRGSDVPVVWGGAHVNVRPEECLTYADMICLGEGEDALLELVDSRQAGNVEKTDIENFWFKVKGDIVKNELRHLENNLDRFPVPELDLERMFVLRPTEVVPIGASHLDNQYSIMTTRGCPYSCTYCYNNYRKKQYKGKGRYLRSRRIENVIRELELARSKFGNIKKIDIMDDSFIARSYEEIDTFSRLYAERIGLPFFALAEPMAFSRKKVKRLRDCGLSELQVGIQSGSERLNRDVYKRKIPNLKVLDMARFINAHGIDVTYDLIFNNPYETVADLKETIGLLLKMPSPYKLQGYNLIFYPKTEITEKALRDAHISRSENGMLGTTIEGACNSPINMRGASILTGGFYEINYTSEEKDYYNTLISMMAYNYMPKTVIRFFFISDNRLKRILLNLVNQGYDLIHRLKSTLINRGVLNLPSG